jgi:hypothetical protein
MNLKNRKRKLSPTETANNNEENFKSTKDKNQEDRADGDANGDEHIDPDDYLIYLETILRKIHDEYYCLYEQRLKSHQKQKTDDEIDESDLPDVKKVLPTIKSKVLENCVITFSGVVPTGYELRKQRCYLLAISLGAKVNEQLVVYDGVEEDNEKTADEVDEDDDSSISNRTNMTSSSSSSSTSLKKQLEQKKLYTTHLVAAKYGTCKVHEALKSSKRPIHVVTPDWLINCNFKWIKCDEQEYKLTKEYDYKNCLFHQEYNTQQKYQTKLIQQQQQQQQQQPSASEKSDESKPKRAKSEEKNQEKEEELLEKKEIKLNESIFELMDKEVDDELDTSDEEHNQEETESSSSNDSSSFNEDDNGDFNDFDDDELAMALERDLVNKNK